MLLVAFLAGLNLQVPEVNEKKSNEGTTVNFSFVVETHYTIMREKNYHIVGSRASIILLPLCDTHHSFRAFLLYLLSTLRCLGRLGYSKNSEQNLRNS